ncbi:hypothetical protein ACHAXS_011363 [Conticribra weissflogii]
MKEKQLIFGAEVKSVDMPDNILKDAIEFSIAALEECSADAEPCDPIFKSAIRSIKEHMDETWTPHWQVIVGRNFGSLVNHEAKRFAYFYVNCGRAVMIYKT